MSSSPIEPTGGKRASTVKLLISGVYVLTPLVMMAYRLYMGQQVDTTVMLVVILFTIAGGYVIFGEKAIEQAQSTTEEITGKGDDDSNEDN